MKAHHEALELITPEAILNECTQLMPTDTAYLEHDLIQRFGSPEPPIYVDGSSDALPLIMPIYNGQLGLSPFPAASHSCDGLCHL